MSQTVSILKELQSILTDIKKADGWQTELGESVHRGFYTHVLHDSSTRFPAVVIHPPTEDPIAVRGGGKGARILVTIPVIMAARIGSDATAYDELSLAAADTRRAIFSARDRLTQITNDEALTVGVAEPEISADSRFALSAFMVSVEFSEFYT